MAVINIRTDDKLKKQAVKVLKAMGLEMTSAIKLFLHQVVIKKTIPFEIHTPNGFTLEEEQNIIQDSKENLEKFGKGEIQAYDSVKEMHKKILNEKEV